MSIVAHAVAPGDRPRRCMSAVCNGTVFAETGAQRSQHEHGGGCHQRQDDGNMKGDQQTVRVEMHESRKFVVWNVVQKAETLGERLACPAACLEEGKTRSHREPGQVCRAAAGRRADGRQASPSPRRQHAAPMLASIESRAITDGLSAGMISLTRKLGRSRRQSLPKVLPGTL